MEEAGDGLENEASLAGTRVTALEFYQNALDLIAAAATRSPGDAQLRSREDALAAKIEARQIGREVAPAGSLPAALAFAGAIVYPACERKRRGTAH